MNARFLPEADDEVREAAWWYEMRGRAVTDRFLDAVVEAQFDVEKHPLRFPPPPGLKTTRQVRRRMLDGFPYIMIYEVRETELLILAVCHTSRRPGYWLRRRP